MSDLYCNLQDLAFALENEGTYRKYTSRWCLLASLFFYESCLHTSPVHLDTYYTPGMVFSNSARIYASNTKSKPAATSSNGVPHPSQSSRAVDVLLSTLDSYRGQVKKEQNIKKEEGESNGASQSDNS